MNGSPDKSLRLVLSQLAREMQSWKERTCPDADRAKEEAPPGREATVDQDDEEGRAVVADAASSMCGSVSEPEESKLNATAGRAVQPTRCTVCGSELPLDPSNQEPGVVFVLGAGCSIQYGFPSFERLLEYAYNDMQVEPEGEDEPGLDTLRKRLDWHWRTLKPQQLRDLLNVYLRGLNGEHATAYLRLARLARHGYVKAIVNMNFDLLLWEALKSQEKPDVRSPEKPSQNLDIWREPLLSRRFDLRPGCHRCEAADRNGRELTPCLSHDSFHKKYIPVYIPHGSLEKGRGVPVLDLAGSDLFSSRDENLAVERLFRENDVVFLGYRGGDAKIAASLRPDRPVFDEQEAGSASYNKVYFFAVDPPDPRLVRIMAAKRSTELTVTGEVAAFENVMKELDFLVYAPRKTEGRTPCQRTKKASSTVEEKHEAHSTEEGERNDAEKRESSIRISPHFTYEESRSLSEWRRLALAIRASMRVAERSDLSIEQHAEDIFNTCLELAGAARIGLTTPEKFLLYCAAYIHDLGYFWAYSGNHKHGKKAGWTLLTTHGHDSAVLLRRYFESQRAENKKTDSGLFPESYGCSDDLTETVIALCHLHSMPNGPKESKGRSGSAKAETGRDSSQSNGTLPKEFAIHTTDGLSILVRPKLLHALFCAAEETAQGHPFRPAPFPLDDHRATEQEIEDPILDLYLRLKPKLLTYEYAPGWICAKHTQLGERRKKACNVLLILARNAIEYLNVIAQEYRRKSLQELIGDPPVPIPELKFTPYVEAVDEKSTAFENAMREAVDEHLRLRLEALSPRASAPNDEVGFVPTVLDLFALYTDPIYGKIDEAGNNRFAILKPPQGRGKTNPSRTFDKTESISGTELRVYLAKLDNEPFSHESKRHPIYHYLKAKYDGEPELRVDKVFRKSFEEIYRPAWRFCSDNWLYGVDALVMARASLDLGSSRFRDEVSIGLKGVFDEHVQFERWPDNASGRQYAYGHDGCTICTSRLLYVAARAREILPSDCQIRPRSGNLTLDELTAALFRFLITRKPNAGSWWGIEREHHAASGNDSHPSAKPLFSADYIVWGIKALASVLVLDKRIERTGRYWLRDECGLGESADHDEIRAMIRALIRQLLNACAREKVLSENTEEPHSYIVGHVGELFLFLHNLETDWNFEILPSDFDWNQAARRVDDLLTVVDQSAAQLSQFFFWPAQVFLAQRKFSENRKKEEDETYDRDAELVKKLLQCIYSRVWIRSGPGRGSWGYNIDNTQRIVSSLNTAWSLILSDKDRFEPHFRKFCTQIRRPSSLQAAGSSDDRIVANRSRSRT